MILRNLRLARAADDVDLTDLTASCRAGAAYWMDGEVDTLIVPLDPEPTEAEAVAIRRRLATTDDADEAHLYELLAAANDPATPTWARASLRAELARYGESTD